MSPSNWTEHKSLCKLSTSGIETSSFSFETHSFIYHHISCFLLICRVESMALEPACTGIIIFPYPSSLNLSTTPTPTPVKSINILMDYLFQLSLPRHLPMTWYPCED